MASRGLTRDIIRWRLEWRHNGLDSVSNHQPYDRLLQRLFRYRSKKTSKLCVTGLCVVPGEFPAEMASNAENGSIWWRHHDRILNGVPGGCDKRERSVCRADSRFVPSQWETALLCNDVSHWLGANLESALRMLPACVAVVADDIFVIQENIMASHITVKYTVCSTAWSGWHLREH